MAWGNVRYLAIGIAACAVAALPRDLAFPIFILSLMGVLDRIATLAMKERGFPRGRQPS